VSPGDEISVKPRSKDILPVQASLEARTRPALLDWLALDEKAKVGRMTRQPTRSDIPLAAQEQLIVELYSK
jgi:small subunit ribosomal protein S4